MQNRLKSCYYYKDEQTLPSPKHDAWHVFILSDLDQSQREGLSGTTAADAPNVVTSYKKCIQARIDSIGAAALDCEFLRWCSNFESRGVAVATTG